MNARQQMMANIRRDIQLETFGDNPCTNLKLINTEDGTIIEKPCDKRSCHHCGPRKAKALQISIETGIGKTAYIHRYTNIDTINRAIEAARKQRSRTGTNFTYTILGDHYLGYYLICDTPIEPSLRRMDLKDWWQRILHIYRYADNRMRRSQGMSRVTLTMRRASRDIASTWTLFRRSHVNRHDEMVALEMAQRTKLITEAGFDPYAFDTWEKDGRVMSTVTMWKRDV